MGGPVVVIGQRPAGGEALLHAHGREHLGVAAAGLGEPVSAHAVAGGGLGRPLASGIGEEGERAEHGKAEEGRNADERMEQEADREIDRHPGQVEEGGGTGAGQEGADLVEVAQGQETVALARAFQRRTHDEIEDAPAQGLVQRGADPGEDAGADGLQHALEGIEHEGERAEADQGRHGAAGDHPVVDLEHEERAGEVEDVHEAAHQSDA